MFTVKIKIIDKHSSHKQKRWLGIVIEDNNQAIKGTMIKVIIPATLLMYIRGIRENVIHTNRVAHFKRLSKRHDLSTEKPTTANGMTIQAETSCVCDRIAVTQHNSINMKAKETSFESIFLVEIA
jgi:hypothetical protein